MHATARLQTRQSSHPLQGNERLAPLRPQGNAADTNVAAPNASVDQMEANRPSLHGQTRSQTSSQRRGAGNAGATHGVMAFSRRVRQVVTGALVGVAVMGALGGAFTPAQADTQVPTAVAVVQTTQTHSPLRLQIAQGIESSDPAPAPSSLDIHSSKGVKQLQILLKSAGYNPGSIDGDYGPATKRMLQRFQAGQGIAPQTTSVDANTVTALLYPSVVHAVVAPNTPGVTANTPFGRYKPYSQEAQSLFLDAAVIAGVPTSWADNSALHRVLEKETQGRVGVPNYTFKSRASDPGQWAQIHAELRMHLVTTGSTATGLGQLTLPNVERFYPDGTDGIGDPLNEAVGMLRYIASRYGTPEVALQHHDLNNWY